MAMRDRELGAQNIVDSIPALLDDVPPRSHPRPALNTKTRQRILIVYAAIGPLLVLGFYLLCRDGGLIPNRGTVDVVVSAAAVIAGCYCAFLGLPGHWLVRAGVTLLYGGCMVVLVVYAAFAVECARGNCH